MIETSACGSSPKVKSLRYEAFMREQLPAKHGTSALGRGVLWPLFDEGLFCAIRFTFLPECESTDEWAEFLEIAPAAFMRVRRTDEVHPE